MRCSCGKYDNWCAGVVGNVLEVHSPSFCQKRRMARWWTRILYAIGSFFTRLAGREANLAMEAYDRWQALWRDSLPEVRYQSSERRMVLATAYDKMKLGAQDE